MDGNLYELSEEITLDKNIKHNIEIIVDRLIVKQGIEKRLADSIEQRIESCGGAACSRCDRRRSSEFQSEAFLARIAESVLKKSSRAAFLSIIRSGHVLPALDWGIKWNFRRN